MVDVHVYLSLKEGKKATSNQGLSVMGWTKMVGRVATAWHISHPQKGAEGVIIQAVSGKEVLVVVVTGGSPEVPYLLWLDGLVAHERWALQRRSRNLKDR
jgi:hypothetical protein